MAVTVQIKHRATGGGGAGSPTGTSLPGELAVNFDTGVGGTPELWASTGTSWARVNPAAAAPTVGTTALPGGAAGSIAGIGTAWTNLASKPTDPIIIASFAGTAYVKTGAGGADADWTALGSATAFATGPETHTGTVTSKAVSPAGLLAAGLAAPTATPAADADYIVRLSSTGKIASGFINSTGTPAATPANDATKLVALGSDGKVNNGFLHTLSTSAGAGSAGSIPVLNAAGKIDASMIALTALSFKGNLDLTAAYAAPGTAPVAGELYTVAKTGSVNASWAAQFVTGQAPTAVTVGDLLIYDGTKFHHVANTVDLSGAVQKAGANAIANDMTMTWAASTAARVILDGGDASKSKLDRVSLDCGVF
jgi:hypothetical protein